VRDGDRDSARVLRRPTDLDQPAIAAVIDAWFGRRVWPLAGRFWFLHAASTSSIALDAHGRPIGILIGTLSQDRPTDAVIHLLAVAPNRRRRGLGRELVAWFLGEATERGATIVTAIAWPDDPAAIGFFRSLGFEPESGAGTQRLYGVPAYPDYEAPGEDRAVLVRRIR
jgi:ribosomal-protein-alanine N-acetyltransferase